MRVEADRRFDRLKGIARLAGQYQGMGEARLGRGVVSIQGDCLLRLDYRVFVKASGGQLFGLEGVGERRRRREGRFQVLGHSLLGARGGHVQIEGPVVLQHVPV